MSGFGGPGPAELMVLLMFLGGFGMPLGVPPEAENPAMAHVAPPKCVMYASWAGMALPDAKSTNHTEQLLAEPEVQQFARSLERSIREALRHYAAESGDPKAEQAARLAPLWAKTVLTRASAVFATKIAASKEEFEFEGGVLVDAGDDAKALVDGLVQLLSSEDQAAEEITLGKSKFFRFAKRERGPPVEMTIGSAGAYVIIGVGPEAVEGMIERLRMKETPKWLTDLHKRLPLERRSSVSYVNTAELVDAFLPLGGPEAARIGEALGVTQLGEMISSTGLDKEGMVSRTLLKIEGDPKGLLTLLEGDGIKPEHLQHIPQDATIALAFSLNTQQVYNVVTQLVAETAPGGEADVARAADQFEDTFGMRLKEDLLASLGHVWTLSMSPADGWLGMVASVEVKDRDQLVAMIDKARQMLADAPPHDAPQISMSRFGKQELYMLEIPQFPLRPAWCITDSRLIFGITPQAVKSSLTLTEKEQGLFATPELAAALKGEGTTIAVNYQDSAKVFEASYSYLTLLVPMMSQMNRFNRGREPAPPWIDVASLPSSRSIHRHLQPSISVTRRTSDGVESYSRQTFPTPNVGASGPVAVALLLPAVQAARSAARRTQSANNLKQIMLALHNHHDTYRTFPPPATTDKDGKPLLSWRVLILPFIEQQALYQQFHLDEPWDSEHNKKLIAKMPEVYKSPSSRAGEGKTVYLGIGGEKGIFQPTKKPSLQHQGGVSMATVTDGTSNTIAVVEANDESAVIWTKPDDYTPVAKDPLKGLLGLYPGGFQVGICDGSVRFISEKIDPKMLMNLFQRNDGNVVDFD